MEQYADEIRTDEIGDVICVLNPESPVRIMLSAHADEIGLVVTRITEEGRIQAIERGGIMTHNYPGQKVQICTKKGIVYGVVECIYLRRLQRNEKRNGKSSRLIDRHRRSVKGRCATACLFRRYSCTGFWNQKFVT